MNAMCRNGQKSKQFKKKYKESKQPGSSDGTALIAAIMERQIKA